MGAALALTLLLGLLVATPGLPQSISGGLSSAAAAVPCTVSGRSTLSPVQSTSGDSCTDNGNGTFTATFALDPSICTLGVGGSCISYDTTITPQNMTPNQPSGPYNGGVECSFLDLGHFVPNYNLNGSNTLPSTFTCIVQVDPSVQVAGLDIQIVNAASSANNEVYNYDFADGAVSSGTPPTAGFNYHPTGSVANQWVFDGSPSVAGAGSTIANYAWKFGDGTTSPVNSSPTVTHTFTNGGNEKVTLTVTDADGLTGTASKTVLVDPIVNSTGDAPGLNPSSGSCDTGNTVTDASGATVPECTLRAAIQVMDANGSAGQSLTFNIPGGGTPVLTPSTPYPAVTAPMTIDGTTQPGAWVEINASGVVSATPYPFQIQAKNVTVSGLSVISAPAGAFTIKGAGGDTLSGNLIGVTPSGTVAPDEFGVNVTAPSVTITGNVIDTASNGIGAVGGVAGLTITGNHVGTNSDGTALAQPSSTSSSTGVVVYADASAPAPAVSISDNVVAGQTYGMVLGGAGLTGLSVTGNEIGVGSGGMPLPSAGVGCRYGLRVDAAPSPTISGNDVGGCTYDLALSGAQNWGINVNSDGSKSLIILDPGDPDLKTAPATGQGAQITDNLVGVEGDGATPVAGTAAYGVDLFADEGLATVSANTVAGHSAVEMTISGGSNDTVSGNRLGESKQGTLVSDLATAGLLVSGVTTMVIGGAAGNDDGDIHGPGVSLTDVTGASVTNNEIGLASDGHTALPDAQGVVLAGTDTGTQIGPGNVISGNTGAGVDDSAPGLTITGNSIGTTPSGAAAVSNGSGVVLEATATNTTVSSNLLGGDPAAGQYQVTQNGGVVQTKVEAGVIDEAPGATITGNRIGINAHGTAAVANTDGVALGGAGSGTIRGNVIADNTVAGIYAGSSGTTVIRSNPIYGNGTGIGGGAAAAPSLTAADRSVSGGVTRTWLAVTGLPGTPGTIEAFGNASCADPEGRYPLKLQSTTPGSPNQIVTILGNASLQGFTVTFTPAGGSTTAFSSCATADTSATDSNGDGVPDDIESLSPYGPAAAASPTFAAAPTDNGGWIGLNLQAGSGRFTNVAPVADPGTEPGGVSFPDGLIAFTLTGIKPGSSVVVDEIYSPTTSIPATYWKYGPTVAGGPPQWYAWNYDASTKIGAVPTRFNVGGTFYAGFALLLTDGAPGDDDLTANGTIYDPGGPAVGPGASTATGYRMAAADGGVFAFGQDAFSGSLTGTHLNAPIVGTVSTPSGKGYWLVAADGGVFAYGDASFHGSAGGTHLNSPVVGMAATPDGGGYWLAAADGGVFAYGDATYSGSEGGRPLHGPVVGIAPPAQSTRQVATS